MIVDFLTIFEKNEMHFEFSNMFRNTKFEWNEIMFHNMNILIFRSLILMFSNVQKMRAIFKLELNIYKNMIVFFFKKTCSLIEKLSNEDYDDNIVWFCRKSNIIDYFQNTIVSKHDRFWINRFEKIRYQKK